MRYWRNFDWWMLVIPLIIVGFSCMMLYEISRWAVNVSSSDPYKQAAYLLIGLVAFWTLANLDYRLLRKVAWLIYGVVLLGLMFVSIVGHSSYGATRWINLGFIQLQPSEPAKLAVVLLLAAFLTEREEQNLPRVAGSLLIAGVPALLVLREPDFGSAVVFVAIWFGMMVMSSTPVRYLAGVTTTAVLTAPIVWLRVLKPFQRARLTSFLTPNLDLQGTNFNPFHAQLAIGSGGPWGEWFGRSTQSRLDFLQVQDKDFIFSVIAEQIGFFGVLLLFSLFAVLLFRLARVAFLSADAFGRLIAGGVLIIFLFQTFVNIGMNMGIMPVTGIPLPLLSYGGSSLITSLAALGVLESILLRHRKLVFDSGPRIA